MFTKALCKSYLDLLCNKLGLYDIHTSKLELGTKLKYHCNHPYIYIYYIMCVRIINLEYQEHTFT